MEIYQVKSFIEITKTKNLTKAASNLYISPSALSSQIKALEDELDIDLFKRNSQGMALTSDGAALLANAKRIVQTSEKMLQKAQELKKNPTGNLNIGINTDPQFLKISRINQKLSKAMPKVRTSFIGNQTFETIPMLIQNNIDAGFLYGKISDLSIFSIQLSTVPVCVVVPCSLENNISKLSFKQITKLPWVWTRHNCPFHIEFKNLLEQNNLSINQVADAVEENIVRELFKEGTGAALMRRDEALEFEKQGIGNTWPKIEMKIPLNFACLGKRKNEKIIHQLFNIIKDNFQ